MARTITRVELEDTFSTVFVLHDDATDTAHEIHIPCWQADDIQTELEALTWTEIDNYYTASSSTVIMSE